MNRLRSQGLLALMLILAVLPAIPACNKHDSGTDVQTPFSAKLVKAVDSSDMEKRLKAELIRRYENLNSRYLYGGYPTFGTLGGGQPGMTITGSSNSGTDTSHSETNVQEAGVDEGDLVKTDGAYIYMARGSHFFVLLANPADQSAVVSDIDLQESISEIYLSDSHVVTVITSRWSSSDIVTIAATGFAPGRTSTMVYCYDVATPASPVLTATFDFPGYVQGSRRINDTLYLVTNFTIDLPVVATPWDYLTATSYDLDAFNAACEKALAENLKQIDAMTLDELLPTRVTTLYTNGDAGAAVTVPAVSVSDIYIPEFGNGIDLSLVSSLDLSIREVVGTSAVLSSWCSIYMSTDNLYLVSNNSWLWIDPVVELGMPAANPEPRTAVHKFGVAGALQYRGSGIVDGWLNDRFSMSDYLGYLRIGTTRGGWWGENISNQLTVLGEQDGQLVELGKLTGLAQGERIYSMRFDRTRGYMVTFKQTDPLYTLDLADPANPRVAGELHLDGFSMYIHLLGTDSTRLLTIGRSADPSGIVIGNKLQLIDVTDLAKPTLLADCPLEAGWSEALYDPHAFLYYEPLGMLTIPYFSYGADTYSSGLDVFNIGTSSISKKGTIAAKTITSGYGAYQDTVDRAVVIGNSIGTTTSYTIYAVAHRSVTAADATTLTVIKTVDLPESYSSGPVVGGSGGGTGGGGIPVTMGTAVGRVRF